MGVLLAFAVGYVVGARAGAQDFDDVVRAVQELRDSEEFRSLGGVLRSHLSHALRSSTELLERAEMPESGLATDLVERVRLLTRKG